MMKLYNYALSSASFRVRIALNLKALKYDYVSVHLRNGEHLQDRFTQINAQALVPALVLDDGQTISQSMAIIEYLEETYPHPHPLLPTDPMLRAKARTLAQLIACDIHPLNNLRVLNYLTNDNDLAISEEKKQMWYHHWVLLGLHDFEKHLTAWQDPQHPFCLGTTPSMVECFLIPQLFNAKRFQVPLDGLSRVMAVFDHAMQHPAFLAAQPSACPQ